jgi:hypothetical protein
MAVAYLSLQVLCCKQTGRLCINDIFEVGKWCLPLYILCWTADYFSLYSYLMSVVMNEPLFFSINLLLLHVTCAIPEPMFSLRKLFLKIHFWDIWGVPFGFGTARSWHIILPRCFQEMWQIKFSNSSTFPCFLASEACHLVKSCPCDAFSVIAQLSC